MDSLFPPGDTGRIPVAAITGVNGKTTVTRLIAHIVRGTGKCVGLTCTDGIYINDRRIESGDCAGPRSARNVLLNREVEVAVLETARGGILREGLGFDRCQVGVVTNIGEGDHLGLDYILTPEDLVRVKGVIAEVVLPEGWAVLNAADPLVAGMIDRTRGCGVIYFARDGQCSVIREHRARGGRAVFDRGGIILMAEGESEKPLTPLRNVPLTRGGRVGFQVENALASAAAAWGLGVAFPTIADGLATFDSEPDITPGRFNVLSVGDATVIVDFGHNPDAIAAAGGLAGGIRRQAADGGALRRRRPQGRRDYPPGRDPRAGVRSHHSARRARAESRPRQGRDPRAAAARPRIGAAPPRDRGSLR